MSSLDTLPRQEVAPQAFDGRFSQTIDALAQGLPEVEESRGQIERGGSAIAAEFELNPEILDDGSRALLFTAIVQRYGVLEERREAGSIPHQEYASEKEFIFDATCLLAREKSGLYEEYKNLITLDRELEGPVLIMTTRTHMKSGFWI